MVRSLPIQRFDTGNVENEDHIESREKPCFGWCAGAIEEEVCSPLDILITTLGWVLVLKMWLTLPITNYVVAEKVEYFVADFDLRTITN